MKDCKRFMVVQARLNPYAIAGAHKFFTERNYPIKNMSDLLYSACLLLANTIEEELEHPLFEDSEEAINYCAVNRLAFTTSAAASKKVRECQLKKNTKKEDSGWLYYDKLIEQGYSPDEALAEVEKQGLA